MRFIRLAGHQVVDADPLPLLGEVEVSIDRGGNPIARYPGTEDFYPVTMFPGRKFRSPEEVMVAIEGATLGLIQ